MEQCQAIVYHKDTYRRTGRGPSGFELHYKRERCKREAGTDGLCWQHRRSVYWIERVKLE